LFCYLDLTEVLASPRQGKKEVFTWLRSSATWILLDFWPAYERGKEEVFTWQCFLFCYLDLTEVLASPSFFLLLGSYWSFGQPKKGGKKRFLPGIAVLLPGPY
jgi:hypothetical protein